MRISKNAQAYMDAIDELMRVRSSGHDEDPVLDRLDDLWGKLRDEDLPIVKEHTRQKAKECAHTSYSPPSSS